MGVCSRCGTGGIGEGVCSNCSYQQKYVAPHMSMIDGTTLSLRSAKLNSHFCKERDKGFLPDAIISQVPFFNFVA
jgi:hypothetical protein